MKPSTLLGNPYGLVVVDLIIRQTGTQRARAPEALPEWYSVKTRSVILNWQLVTANINPRATIAYSRELTSDPGYENILHLSL